MLKEINELSRGFNRKDGVKLAHKFNQLNDWIEMGGRLPAAWQRGTLRVSDGPVDRESGQALYRQIADRWRSLITSGLMAPGDRLPSETQLIERYGVTRPTVRHALDVLHHEGLTKPIHGMGVFVAGGGIEPPTSGL